jgi:hypothetical protein
MLSSADSRFNRPIDGFWTVVHLLRCSALHVSLVNSSNDNNISLCAHAHVSSKTHNAIFHLPPFDETGLPSSTWTRFAIFTVQLQPFDLPFSGGQSIRFEFRRRFHGRRNKLRYPSAFMGLIGFLRETLLVLQTTDIAPDPITHPQSLRGRLV